MGVRPLVKVEGESPQQIMPELKQVRMMPAALWVPTPILSPCAPPWVTG